MSAKQPNLYKKVYKNNSLITLLPNQLPRMISPKSCSLFFESTSLFFQGEDEEFEPYISQRSIWVFNLKQMEVQGNQYL
jgi:hypothetical protein